ncbi:MAG: bifunctional DNA-formamidopyrimidine glycosylase/DNA-(apurinic or apyrimidinic site) lyase [Akkermansiaceae bacterium]
MPELPEVETTVRGVRPHLMSHHVSDIIVRESRMRWPIIEEDVLKMIKLPIQNIERRAKYILVSCKKGTLILHLGMSGSLRICPRELELKKHDHFIMRLSTGMELRLHDPRRFGCVLWHDASEGDILNHHLLTNLGPEPLTENFNPQHLSESAKGRKTTIKQLIMNNKFVVGVGNIYACEALFRSGIHPTREAGKISKLRLSKLTTEIKKVLTEAITQGGTTLRDFLNESGNPGYFKQKLTVYDRETEPCRICKTPIKKIVISARSTFYCPKCQR